MRVGDDVHGAKNSYDTEVKMNSSTLHQRPSAGTVLGAMGFLFGLVALIVSVSSPADASSHGRLVHANEIAAEAITANKIHGGAVTAKKLAANAVTSVKLATGSVNRRVIKKEAVTANGLAAASVTRVAIAPGSVYSGALVPESIHATPISDLDEVAHNGEWKASNSEVAFCGPGEALLGTGFAFTGPGNGQVSFLQASPILASTGNAVIGRFASDAGGTAKAEVIAICLGS
jgi:hypothetical protein